MIVKVGLNAETVKQVRMILEPRRAQIAMQAAVARTVRSGRTMISARIREEVHLKKAAVDRTISIKTGSWRDPGGSIVLSRDAAVWLIEFATSRQREAGLAKKRTLVRVKVRKKPTPKYPTTEVHPRAFYARMPHSQHPGIFERTGIRRPMRSGRYAGQIREVIRRKRGPTPLGVFLHARGEGAATVLREIEIKLAELLEKNMDSQIDRFLRPRASTTAWLKELDTRGLPE